MSLGDFFHSLGLKARFNAKLAVIEAQPTAGSQGKTECCRSGVCCWRRPCLLGAADPEPIAAHLGLSSPQELFRQFLVVDQLHGILFLLPRRRQQEGGRYLSMVQTYDLETPCVFLSEDNACTIHEVKPQGGRQYKCWDASAMPEWPPGLAWTEERLRDSGWDGNTEAAS